MIQSIKINLNKTTFTLNNGAYEKLNAYMLALKTSFKNESEIVLDIEARIAELLTIQLADTQADVVNAFHIDEVIKTVGTIEELTNSKNEHKQTKNSEFSDSNNNDNQLIDKKLRRSSFNQSLSGVSSGLAYYFNLDISLVRFAFVVSLFFFGTGVFAYLILWIFVPKATGTQAEDIKNYEFNNPNKLFRIKETKVIGGVCSGLAVHLGIEIWVVRLVFFIGIFVFGFSILGYFLAWLIIPMAYTDFQKTKINTNSQYVDQNNEQLDIIRNIFKIIIVGIALVLIGILVVSFFFTAGLFNLFTDSTVYDFLIGTFPVDENLSLMVTGVLLVLFTPILFLLTILAKFAFKANIHLKYTGSGLIFAFFLGIGLLVYSGLTSIPGYYKLLDSTDNSIDFLPANDSLKIIINDINTGKSVDFFSQQHFKIQLCDSGMFIPIEYQIEKTLENKATYEIIRKYKGGVIKDGASPSPMHIDFTISNDSIIFPSHYFLAKPYKFKFQKAKVKFHLRTNNTFYANKTAQQAFGFIHKNDYPTKFWFSMDKFADFENSDDEKLNELEQRQEEQERRIEEKQEKLERELEEKENELERKAEELERKLEQKQNDELL